MTYNKHYCNFQIVLTVSFSSVSDVKEMMDLAEGTAESLLYVVQHMNPEERELLLQRLNFSSEEQLLSFLSPTVALEDFAAYRIHKYLLLYIPPIMMLVGTIGNILSFGVFRMNTGKVSTYTYLSALAIMDLLVLYIGLMRLWIAQLTNIDIKDQANWICKVVVFLGYVSSDSSVWLIVAVTVERFVAVCYPLQASNLCRMRKARYIVCVPILALCVVNSHFLWTVELHQIASNNSNSSYICDAAPPFTALVNDIWTWVDAGIYSFVPFVILSVLNGNIIKNVYIAKNERKHLLTTDGNGRSASRRIAKQNSEVSRKLTMMLLLVSCTFLLTTLPMNIILIMTKSWNDQSKQQQASFYLAKTISELLMYLNHTINVFLYCTTGKKFRRQIFVFMCQCIPKAKKFSSDNTTSATRGFALTRTSGSKVKVLYRSATRTSAPESPV